MNKTTIIIILSVALFVAISFSALAFYKYGKDENNTENKQKIITEVSSEDESSGEESCCSAAEGKGDITENSLYQIDAGWTDQSGNKFFLSELKGKKVVLAMIFANCTYACPLIVNDMKNVERTLSDKEKAETEFVLVSIDPERDTPETLNEYAKIRQLDLNRWTLLTGSHHDIRELAALLGFKYKKDDKGDFSHTNLINILNKQGDVIYQHEGLNKKVDGITSQLISFN